MALITVTSDIGEYTYEISSGTNQEIVDRLAALREARVENAEIQILGFGYSGTSYFILAYYLKTPR